MMRYAAILLSATVLVFTSCSGAVSGQADIESFVDDARNFRVSYDANGGTGSIAPSVHAVGSSITLDNGFSMTHPDYALRRWNTATDGSGTFYTPSSVIKMPPKDLILYAVWGDGYLLSYDGNGNGIGHGSAPIPQLCFPGNTVEVAANSGVLYRLGNYAFDGWNTQANGLGTSYAPGSTFVFANAPMTLYARWKSVSGPVTLDTPTPPTGVSTAPDRHDADTGTCWEFDGYTPVSYDSADLQFAYNEPFSISIWFMPTSLPSTGYPRIVSMVCAPHSFHCYLMLAGTHGGDLSAVIGSSHDVETYLFWHVDEDIWHHAVMVYDGSMLEFYVDGVSRGTGQYNNGDRPPPSTVMELGGGESSPFIGSIGELKVYDRALGADEVAALSAN